MADLRKYNVNDDPMQALRNLLEMQDDEYSADAVLTEAVSQIEHHRKAETLATVGVEMTGEDSRFAEHAEKRINRYRAEYAEWLESSENAKRECAATAILEIVIGAVDTYLCNYEYIIDGYGKRHPIEKAQESIRVIAESDFSNKTGIDIDHLEDDQ